MSVGRITNLMLSRQVLNNINADQSQLATTEEELSSGKTINQPSDNPYGAALAISLNGQLSQLSDYTNNLTDGQSWTSAGLSALNNMTTNAQRAQELVTGAMNPISAEDRQADAKEIYQLVEQIKSDANTQYDGQYIFAGASTTQQPYSTANDTPPSVDASGTVTPASVDQTYSGDSGIVSRTVGQGQTVQVNSSVSQVLSDGGSGQSGLITQLTTIANKLMEGTAPSASDLSTLQTTTNALTTQSTTLGAASQSLSMTATRLQSLQTSVTASLSDDQDANYAQVSTDFSNQQAAFEAALKAGASIVQSSLMDFLSS